MYTTLLILTVDHIRDITGNLLEGVLTYIYPPIFQVNDASH
jgi:hypothetical protein